ncbi:MAG: carbohydrate ABC transporter permease [Chloroflexi bacterium]|jgi:glucose/mannose transport system permease protein|nr:carbohydrate ABC transporter permease [Chloroflexota bacterium]
MNSGKKAFRLDRIIIYFLLFVAAAYFLMPVYLLVITGFKSYQQVSLSTMWQLPTSFSLESFSQAWSGSAEEGYRGLQENFMNSIWLTIPAALLSAFIGSINGYIFSKWKFRGSDVLFSMLLFGMFIPYQSVLIPIVRVLQWLTRYTGPIHEAIQSWHVAGFFSWLPAWLAGFVPAYGTIGGLILIHVIYGLPIATLIFRNYYTEIPTDLVEAGMVDGANLLGIYRRILFPISMPGFVVVLIWQFTSIWNDFLFGVIVTSNPSVQPVTVALNNLAGSYIVEWNVQMAGSLIAALPTMLVYVLLSRYFIRGLMAGSVKG